MIEANPSSPSPPADPPTILYVGVARPIAAFIATRVPGFGDVGSRRTAIVEILTFTLLYAGLLFLAAFVAVGLGVHDERWLNVYGGTFAGLGMLVAIVMLHRIRGLPLSVSGFRADSLFLEAVLGASLTLLTLAVCGLLAVALFVLVPGLSAEMQQTQETIQRSFPRMSRGHLVLMSAWVAVFEEAVFRGFLLPRLRLLVRWWPAAIVIGSGAFALLHLYQGAFAAGIVFVLGVAFGAVFVWRRSVAPVIVWHFLFNSVQLLLLCEAASDWR